MLKKLSIFLVLFISTIAFAENSLPTQNGLLKPPQMDNQGIANNSPASTQSQADKKDLNKNNANNSAALPKVDLPESATPKKHVETPEEKAKKIEDLSKQTMLKPYIDDATIIIGSGPIGGIYFPAASTICRILNKSQKEVKCGVEATSGSMYNIKSLRSAEIDFALIQSDWEEMAFDATGLFVNDTPFEKLRFVFSLHNEALTMIVKKDSGINTLDDIKGKIVNIGQQGSGVRSILDLIFVAKGWTNQSFKKVTELPSAEQSDQLCKGNIDVMVTTTGHPSGLIQQAMTNCDVQILPIDDQTIKDLLIKHQEYSASEILEGTYPGVTHAVNTIGMKAVLVTTTDTSEDVVYKLTKSIFENLDAFKKKHPIFYNLDKNDMINQAVTSPLHPGALKYYQEVGLIK